MYGAVLPQIPLYMVQGSPNTLVNNAGLPLVLPGTGLSHSPVFGAALSPSIVYGEGLPLVPLYMVQGCL